MNEKVWIAADGRKAHLVERYGVMTWADQELDALRRTNCLCRRCKRLKPDRPDNCPMAEVVYALCKTKGMAMGVSRCQDFYPKSVVVKEADDAVQA